MRRNYPFRFYFYGKFPFVRYWNIGFPFVPFWMWPLYWGRIKCRLGLHHFIQAPIYEPKTLKPPYGVLKGFFRLCIYCNHTDVLKHDLEKNTCNWSHDPEFHSAKR